MFFKLFLSSLPFLSLSLSVHSLVVVHTLYYHITHSALPRSPRTHTHAHMQLLRERGEGCVHHDSGCGVQIQRDYPTRHADRQTDRQGGRQERRGNTMEQEMHRIHSCIHTYVQPEYNNSGSSESNHRGPGQEHTLHRSERHVRHQHAHTLTRASRGCFFSSFLCLPPVCACVLDWLSAWHGHFLYICTAMIVRRNRTGR